VPSLSVAATSSTNSLFYSPEKVHTMHFLLLLFHFICTITTATSPPPPPPPPPPPQVALFRAAARSDFPTLLQLLPTSTPSINTNHDSQQTVLHHLIAAQFQRLTYGTSSNKQCKAYTKFLKKILRKRYVDPSMYCPLVDAVHYRLSSTVKILINALNITQLQACLAEPNIFGEHVLHVASKSKASGFARHFLTGKTHSKRINRELGVSSEGVHGARTTGRGRGRGATGGAKGNQENTKDTASFGALNHRQTVHSVDLSVLLAAGEQAYRGTGRNLSDWLLAPNVWGETPMMVGCRSGRVDVVEKLRAASHPGRNPGGAFETVFRMTCMHVAAARGHAR
jgi:hypothetical protein